jgi:hypothetical protein
VNGPQVVIYKFRILLFKNNLIIILPIGLKSDHSNFHHVKKNEIKKKEKPQLWFKKNKK